MRGYLIRSSRSILPPQWCMKRWACMATSCFLGPWDNGIALAPQALEQPHDAVAGGRVRVARGLAPKLASAKGDLDEGTVAPSAGVRPIPRVSPPMGRGFLMLGERLAGDAIRK